MHNFVFGNKATGARPVTTEVEWIGDRDLHGRPRAGFLVGVDRRTGKPFVGKMTWKLPLTAGTYRFGSQDPRLRGHLTVG